MDDGGWRIESTHRGGGGGGGGGEDHIVYIGMIIAEYHIQQKE